MWGRGHQRTVGSMGAPTGITTPTMTVLRASRLFDGASSALLRNPTVVFEDGRLTSVTTGRASVPEGAVVVDLPEATLLPGLVDAHLHLAFDASDDPIGHLAAIDDHDLLERMAGAARRALNAGITTIRDLGDRGYLALKLRDAEGSFGPLPTIVAAGPPITTPGGHCHFLGGEVSGQASIRRAVAERVERGVDVIKVMASGGHITPGSCPHAPQFGPKELRAAVEEAHRHGLPVTMHAHSAQSIADAVEAGADGIEHATFMTATGVDASDELVDRIVSQRIAIGATIARDWHAKREPPPAIAKRISGLRANHRRLHEAGALMVASSDAGTSPVTPHDALRWAPDRLIEIGFTPVEALWAITSRAAQVCGLGHRKGRIEPGYDADIVAVEGDPFADPSALRRVRAVYSGGRLVPQPQHRHGGWRP
jgi:imidazolonepropionase-like amidohydrolase